MALLVCLHGLEGKRLVTHVLVPRGIPHPLGCAGPLAALPCSPTCAPGPPPHLTQVLLAGTCVLCALVIKRLVTQVYFGHTGLEVEPPEEEGEEAAAAAAAAATQQELGDSRAGSPLPGAAAGAAAATKAQQQGAAAAAGAARMQSQAQQGQMPAQRGPAAAAAAIGSSPGLLALAMQLHSQRDALLAKGLAVQNGLDDVATFCERLAAAATGQDVVASSLAYAVLVALAGVVYCFGFGAAVFAGVLWLLRPPLLRVVPETEPYCAFMHHLASQSPEDAVGG